MSQVRPTFEKYRGMSPEDRELARMDETLKYLSGDVAPIVVFRGELDARALREPSPANPPRPMSKTRIVAAIAEAARMDRDAANRALEALSEVMAREVAAGGAVTLPGVGKFSARARPTDRTLQVTVAKFLREVLNK